MTNDIREAREQAQADDFKRRFRTPEKERSPFQLGRWSETNVFVSIAAMVALGAVVAATVWASLIGSCIGEHEGWWFSYICTPVKSQMPWTALTGLVAGPALLLTWYWRTTQRLREIKVAEYQEVTTRFARAVELLGSDNLAQCLGGAYALGRLAQDSSRETIVVIDTLCAFVRSTPLHTQALMRSTQETALDDRAARMEAVVRVLSQLNGRGESTPFLVGARLFNLHIPRANLSGATLTGAFLRNCKFAGANFNYAQLSVCDMKASDFRFCKFENADLNGADLRDSNLEGAKLGGANLRAARLENALLAQADLREVELEGARYNDKTQFPTGFDPAAFNMRKVDPLEVLAESKETGIGA